MCLEPRDAVFLEENRDTFTWSLDSEGENTIASVVRLGRSGLEEIQPRDAACATGS
jgi:hypothetical protein